MKRFALLGLLALPSCVPAVTTDVIQLTPANEIALQDGTPIARLTGFAGDPRATVSFIYANGDTLSGDAIMNSNVENTMSIWGQTAQTLSSTSIVEMVAIDDKQKMACRGTLSPQATHMTCSLSDGAIYRDDYVIPPSAQPALAAQSSSK